MNCFKILTSTAVLAVSILIAPVVADAKPGHPNTPEHNTTCQECLHPSTDAHRAACPECVLPDEAMMSETSAWFRVDNDSSGLLLWFGASHPLSDAIDLATDITMSSQTGRFDLGVNARLGDVILTPMVGVEFNWEANSLGSSRSVVDAIVPQLYATYMMDKIHAELWTEASLNSLINDTPRNNADLIRSSRTLVYSDIDVYFRAFALYGVHDAIKIGPQVEGDFWAVTQDTTDSDLETLYVGGRANVNYTDNSTLGIFVGYETLDKNDIAADNALSALAARLTFVHTW